MSASTKVQNRLEGKAAEVYGLLPRFSKKKFLEKAIISLAKNKANRELFFEADDIEKVLEILNIKKTSSAQPIKAKENSGARDKNVAINSDW